MDDEECDRATYSKRSADGVGGRRDEDRRESRRGVKDPSKMERGLTMHAAGIRYHKALSLKTGGGRYKKAPRTENELTLEGPSSLKHKTSFTGKSTRRRADRIKYLKKR